MLRRKTTTDKFLHPVKKLSDASDTIMAPWSGRFLHPIAYTGVSHPDFFADLLEVLSIVPLPYLLAMNEKVLKV